MSLRNQLVKLAKEAVKRFNWLSIELEMPSDEEHSCLRKIRYGHFASATKAAQEMEKKLGRRMEAYLCRYCDGWHVGSARW